MKKSIAFHGTVNPLPPPAPNKYLRCSPCQKHARGFHFPACPVGCVIFPMTRSSRGSLEKGRSNVFDHDGGCEGVTVHNSLAFPRYGGDVKHGKRGRGGVWRRRQAGERGGGRLEAFSSRGNGGAGGGRMEALSSRGNGEGGM